MLQALIWLLLALVPTPATTTSCDMMFSHNSCVPDLLNSDDDALFFEASRMKQCFVKQENSNRTLDGKWKENVLCLMKNITSKLHLNECQVDKEDNVFCFFSDYQMELEVRDFSEDYDCFLCFLAHFHFVLHNQPCSDNCALKLKDNFSTLFLLVYFKMQTLPSGCIRSDLIKSVLNLRSWAKSQYLETNTHRKIDILDLLKYNKLKEIGYDFILRRSLTVVGVSLVIVIAGLFGNGMIIFIGLRHRELLTDTNMMMFNQAVAHFLFIIITSTFLYFPAIEIELMNSNMAAVSYMFVWSVVTGACVYSVMMMSVQRYVAVVSMTSHTSHRNYVCAVWALGFVASLPMLSLYFTYLKKHVRIIFGCNFFTYAFVPVTVVAVTSVATSRHLKRSILSMPGEGIGQQMVKRSRARSASFLVLLSMAFTMSYLPVYLMDVLIAFLDIPPYVICVLYIPLGYMFMMLTACCNPYGLYIVSTTFRRHCNRYLLCCCTRHSISDTASKHLVA